MTALSLAERDGGRPWRARACAFGFLGDAPSELQAALEGRFGAQDVANTAPSRSDLHTLMQRFPDEEI